MQKLILEYLSDIVILFFIFSILGWCMEVTLKYRQYHRFINRGFLIGPYLPIYGSGVALVTVLLDFCTRYEDSYGLTFVISFFACGSLEYFVSYYLEKRFHARWWDYSQKPMNLHGRVWIGNLILFGIGGTIVGKIIDPIYYEFIAQFPLQIKSIVSGCIVLVMGADYTTSHFVMKVLKAGVESSEADNTEALSKEMLYLLTNRSVLHKRLADAYPEVIYRTDKVYARLNAMKAESEALSRELRNRIYANRDELMNNLEPTSQIRISIINKQSELILLLESGSCDDDRMNVLRSEIAALKERLDERDALLARISPMQGLQTLKQYTDNFRPMI